MGKRVTRRALMALPLFAFPAAAAIPTSARSTTAEGRVAPRLQKELAAAGLTLGAPIFLRITKEPAELDAFVRHADGKYSRFRTYPICAFSGGLGPKVREGDMQAPEGVYAITPQQMNPSSSFHLSFNLGYPNALDRALGRTGSFLMVHGNCVSIGCYAMGDPAIEEIWTLMAAAFRAGQRRVTAYCFPFALTPQALAARARSPHAAFWADLAPIWAAIEETRMPPRVSMAGGRYRLTP